MKQSEITNICKIFIRMQHVIQGGKTKEKGGENWVILPVLQKSLMFRRLTAQLLPESRKDEDEKRKKEAKRREKEKEKRRNEKKEIRTSL